MPFLYTLNFGCVLCESQSQSFCHSLLDSPLASSIVPFFSLTFVLPMDLMELSVTRYQLDSPSGLLFSLRLQTSKCITYSRITVFSSASRIAYTPVIPAKVSGLNI